MTITPTTKNVLKTQQVMLADLIKRGVIKIDDVESALKTPVHKRKTGVCRRCGKELRYYGDSYCSQCYAAYNRWMQWQYIKVRQFNAWGRDGFTGLTAK